jgi:holo-[acyl-carrier protein] synthase
MALAVGVDMSEVGRIRRLLERYGERFSDRIFTAQEQAYCAGRAGRLAGRFAVKEAVAKALGTGIGAQVAWTDIEVVSDARGKPELVLHRGARRRAAQLGLAEWAISLSHTETMAIGFVVATAVTDE